MSPGIGTQFSKQPLSGRMFLPRALVLAQKRQNADTTIAVSLARRYAGTGGLVMKAKASAGVPRSPEAAPMLGY